jgi:molybdenum cofactor cytidylyltransferase
MSDGVALLLAAGRGRRFGDDKRLAALPDGTPVLMRTLERFTEAFPEVRLVLRPDDEALVERVRETFPSVRCIVAADAHRGMGHSLAAGARSLGDDGRWIAVGLADMPWIRPDTLRRLAERMAAAEGDGTILVPVLEGHRGHPVCFGPRHREALTRLEGDTGARAVVAAGAPLLETPVDDPGVLRDVDVPADLSHPDRGR